MAATKDRCLGAVTWAQTEAESKRGRRQRVGAAAGMEFKMAVVLDQARGLAVGYREVHCCCLDGVTGWAELAILSRHPVVTAPVQSSQLGRSGHPCLLPHTPEDSSPPSTVFFSPSPREAYCLWTFTACQCRSRRRGRWTRLRCMVSSLEGSNPGSDHGEVRRMHHASTAC